MFNNYTVLQLLFDKLVIRIYSSVGVSTLPASWSVLLSLTAYSISFTILGMLFLVSHWRQWHLSVQQASYWPSYLCAVSWLFEGNDQSISQEVADCSLEAALVTALPSTRKNLLDKAKVLTSFPALASPPFSVGQDISRSVRRFS